jgi:hypothetical protein
VSGSSSSSPWHRDELGTERKVARRKCSKALAPILDIIRTNAVHASLKAVGASRECPARHSAFAISPGSFARRAGSCGGCARGNAAGGVRVLLGSASVLARLATQNAPDWPREVRYAARSGAEVTKLGMGGNQARTNKQYSGQSWRPRM